ncbi:hypothetical protein B0T16DRAFT_43443 [Cercophora newfieldiana]|uniref:Uncharacterized protein n=1 Tax=Cercophora newfieldiana TaxID=92897 RepID=A0AA39YQ87_9PEZI|nr:hypothetical protein B0T16DRAFT_43443 [Cercophora newfieldiana]
MHRGSDGRFQKAQLISIGLLIAASPHPEYPVTFSDTSNTLNKYLSRWKLLRPCISCRCYYLIALPCRPPITSAETRTPPLTQDKGDTTCRHGQGRNLQQLFRDRKGRVATTPRALDGGKISYFSMRCASTGSCLWLASCNGLGFEWLMRGRSQPGPDVVRPHTCSPERFLGRPATGRVRPTSGTANDDLHAGPDRGEGLLLAASLATQFLCFGIRTG